MARAGKSARGVTLIELLIVLAIVAFVAAAAAPAISSVTGANARAAAGELAGAMRWLFDTAALRHQTCRLALDLDHRAWWAECTSAEERGTPALGKGGAPPEEDDEALADRFPDEQSAERRRLLARTKFGAYSDRQVGRKELPGSAAFGEVWTQRQREPVAKGIAYVYFFPQAQTEAARVPIVDGGHVYSVVLQPFTGRARVVSGVPEVRP